jgi:hypothetical protein
VADKNIRCGEKKTSRHSEYCKINNQRLRLIRLTILKTLFFNGMQR